MTGPWPPPPPPPNGARAADPAFARDATVEVTDVSVWFGPKVALSELSCSFGPGVTGLLGPNGAGKTTLMRSMTGLLGVNQGSISVEGRDPRRDRQVHRRVALVPEDEAVPAALTARQFVRYVADLHGVADRQAPDRALDAVGMLEAADRRVDGFSKGMRQRTKVASALVTEPQVLVLDEPLNGADPVQRIHLIALFKRLGADGRTVIVSSHVLNEVERMAERVIVLIQGRLAAAGDHRGIRDAMDDRPRHVLVRSDDGRRLAGSLVGLESVAGVTFDRARDGVVIQTEQARELATALPVWPVTRRCGSPRCGPSTTRWRACSGSWSDDGADHDVVGRPATEPVRRDRRLLAAGVLPAQALGGDPPAVRRRAAVRAAHPRRRRSCRRAPSPTSPPRGSSG